MIKASESIMIPARVSVRDLADAIKKEVGEVQSVLTARNEPNGPGDLPGADPAVAAAGGLGGGGSVRQCIRRTAVPLFRGVWGRFLD